jgi:hypothetical protein
MRHLYDLLTRVIYTSRKTNILAGMQSLPWDGIHHRKSRSSSTAIPALWSSDVRKRKTALTRFVPRSCPSWPTRCSDLTWRMTNACCIGTARLSNSSYGSRSPHFIFSSYELQVSQSVQRGGIGKRLMKCLYDIARGWQMQKVMLTVFKGDDTSVLWIFPSYSELRPQRTKQHSYFTRPWGLCAIPR